MTVESLRRLNSWELFGIHELQHARLDDLVAEHLQVVAELRRLNATEELVLRMSIENFTVADIARECRTSDRAIYRIKQLIRRKVLWSDPRVAA